MFGKAKHTHNERAADERKKRVAEEREMVAQILSNEPHLNRPVTASSAGSAAPEATSSISSGLSFVGKIVGEGTLKIFGHVEGEVHASTVEIGHGAKVDGDVVAEELTVAGRVKGTLRANRVRLNSTAVVEGDIYHRSLAIEENAQFAGMSRRQEHDIDTPSLVPAKRSRAQSTIAGRQEPGPSDLSRTQTAPIP